ncbi:MAG: hydroxymethylbilane synthase, partial [Solirubrobacteraceae bacterium]
MRIGTRASALALVQARWVADRLAAAGEAVQIVEVTTHGDRGAPPTD